MAEFPDFRKLKTNKQTKTKQQNNNKKQTNKNNNNNKKLTL